VRKLMVAVMLSGCAVHAASTLHAGRLELKEAKSVDTNDRALFERTLAEAYLNEARDQARFSSYKAAIEFAREGREWAQKAKAIASEAP
jgi:hypothetical protein